MISTGFDASEQDLLAGMRLTSDCFGQLATRIKNASDRLCNGRLTFFLEGGYSLNALKESTLAMTNGVLQKTDLIEPETNAPISPSQTVIANAVEGLAPHWPKIFSDIS